MIPLSVAALTNAHKPNFTALVFSDVKAPTGNSADYKHAAAEDLGRMGLVARAEEIFYGSPMGRGSDRTAMAVVAPRSTTTPTASCGRLCLVGRSAAQ